MNLETLRQRRALTEQRLSELTANLQAVGALEIAEGRACIYATGSLGRGEMSSRSDLDVFIVRDRQAESPLTNLDEIRLKARLIEESRKLGFPDFSDDGEYVKSYDIKSDFLNKLGGRSDDYDNVLTARLLLLLESRPVLGPDVYRRAIGDLISAYWRDFPQNSKNFLPVFLTNDILRFWKTLCLNYEERTGAAETDRGKRRLLNYKLKYSRLLTCYSAIIYLLVVLRLEKGTVTTEKAFTMVETTPTKRLEWVAGAIPDVSASVDRILQSYQGFLQTCEDDKAALITKFEDSEFKRLRFGEARQFGADVYNLVMELGKDTELLRYLVV
jgi:hypothetical protein